MPSLIRFALPLVPQRTVAHRDGPVQRDGERFARGGTCVAETRQRLAKQVRCSWMRLVTRSRSRASSPSRTASAAKPAASFATHASRGRWERFDTGIPPLVAPPREEVRFDGAGRLTSSPFVLEQPLRLDQFRTEPRATFDPFRLAAPQPVGERIDCSTRLRYPPQARRHRPALLRHAMRPILRPRPDPVLRGPQGAPPRTAHLLRGATPEGPVDPAPFPIPLAERLLELSNRANGIAHLGLERSTVSAAGTVIPASSSAVPSKQRETRYARFERMSQPVVLTCEAIPFVVEIPLALHSLNGSLEASHIALGGSRSRASSSRARSSRSLPARSSPSRRFWINPAHSTPSS